MSLADAAGADAAACARSAPSAALETGPGLGLPDRFGEAELLYGVAPLPKLLRRRRALARTALGASRERVAGVGRRERAKLRAERALPSVAASLAKRKRSAVGLVRRPVATETWTEKEPGCQSEQGAREAVWPWAVGAVSELAAAAGAEARKPATVYRGENGANRMLERRKPPPLMGCLRAPWVSCQLNHTASRGVRWWPKPEGREVGLPRARAEASFLQRWVECVMDLPAAADGSTRIAPGSEGGDAAPMIVAKP